jgi:SagB-type dehydrogenase family enzyme
MDESTLLRRPTTLVCYWLDGFFHIENYLEGSTQKASPDVVSMLDQFSSPKSLRDAAEGSGVPLAEVSEFAEAAVASSLLAVEDPLGDVARDCKVDRVWESWPHDARYFHFATRDAPYLSPGSEQDDYVAEISSSAPPPILKRYPEAPRIYLTRFAGHQAVSFFDVLTTRRTTRTFRPGQIPERTLSQVLQCSFSPLKVFDAGLLGAVQIRPYAAAGARHEIECYIRVSRVAEIEPGLYHYDPFEHALEWIAADPGDKHLQHITYEQDFCGLAPFTIFTTAVLERMIWKYKHPRAYRALLLDAGHQAQVFAMVATAFDLGPFQTAAFRDQSVAEMLGIDGISEVPMYCMGAGPPCEPENDPDQAVLMSRSTWARSAF